VDIDKLIDLNRYTLAIAKAGFIYTLVSFVPMQAPEGRFLLLFIPFVLLCLIVSGILLFATATSGGANPSPDQKRWITRFGIVHAAPLLLGFFVVGGMLTGTVVAEPTSAEAPATGRACHHKCTCPTCPTCPTAE
jgi:ABC-type Na+ efflux pump permease subunit